MGRVGCYTRQMHWSGGECDILGMGSLFPTLPSAPSPQVTRLHLRTIRSMMTAISDAHIVSLVANVEAKMTATYGAMSTGQLHMVRQTLQRFFLGGCGWCRGACVVVCGVFVWRVFVWRVQ